MKDRAEVILILALLSCMCMFGATMTMTFQTHQRVKQIHDFLLGGE